MAGKGFTTIRIAESDRDALRVLADAEQRSMANMIRRLIRLGEQVRPR